MKTNNGLVKGLVNELNGLFGYGDFYIEKDDEMDSYTLYMKALGTVGGLIELSKEYKSWIALPSFGLASADVQKNIMDFIYTTDSNHWFDEPEKKYNIIIGEDMSGNFKTVYYKAGNVVDVTDTAGEYELVSDQYQFTESEIEALKATLPENMAKIVELGKVEVKDED